MILIKRAYDPIDDKDGFRVLVNRLWPRGLKKHTAKIDKWAKEIAPSAPLRKWFNHQPEKWSAFKQAYKEELSYNNAVTDLLEEIRINKVITLLYAAREEKYNHAIVLHDFLMEKLNNSILKTTHPRFVPDL